MPVCRSGHAMQADDVFCGECGEPAEVVSATRLTMPVAVLLGAVLIAAAILAGALVIARSSGESEAYKIGYDTGVELGSSRGADVDQVCDGDSFGFTIDDRNPTPADLDDYADGCRDGFEDAD